MIENVTDVLRVENLRPPICLEYPIPDEGLQGVKTDAETADDGRPVWLTDEVVEDYEPLVGVELLPRLDPDLVGPLPVQVKEDIIALGYCLHGEAWVRRGIKPSPHEAELLTP